MTLDAPRITREGDRYRLEYSEIYATDRDDLWSAVTTAERLSRWMADYRGDLREGGAWEVRGSDGEVWCRGVVTSCHPPQTFTTTWHAVGEDPTELVVRLDEVDGGTRLTLTHAGIQSIFYGAGWQAYLEQLHPSLTSPQALLVDDAAWDARFEQLRPVYDERFAGLREG